jgi:hypothetical protein
MVTMARRAVLAVLITLLAEPGQQLLQVVVALLAYGSFFLLQYFQHPFIDDRLNWMERLALLSHVLVAALGIIFVPGQRRLRAFRLARSVRVL